MPLSEKAPSTVIMPKQSIDDVSTNLDEYPQRTKLVGDYAGPYHVHFLDGEGENLNPEGAEHNLDASLVLTYMIRNRVIVNKSNKFVSGAGLGQSDIGSSKQNNEINIDPDEEIGWFADKYPRSDVQFSHFKKPTTVVSTWLKKLGPHNDLAEAEIDLKSARQWLIEDEQANKVKGRQNSNNSKLIASINLELSELVDDGQERTTYLQEAASYLADSRNNNLRMNKFGDACVDQSMLSYVRIELAREKIFGTKSLIDSTDPELYAEFSEQYTKFEEDVKGELHGLGTLMSSSMHELTSQLDFMENEGKTTFDLSKKDERDYIKNFSLMYEALTYYQLLDRTYASSALTIFKSRPGTIRQESGSTDKIITPHSEQNPKSGFNFNYDLLFDSLRTVKFDSLSSPGDFRGYVDTIYVQNKADRDYAKTQEAGAHTADFYGGKQFMFLTPESTIDLLVDIGDKFKFTNTTQSMRTFTAAMQKQLRKRDQVNNTSYVYQPHPA